MRYREFAKRLRELNCEQDRPGKGSHFFWRNKDNGKTTSIPDWGHKDLKPGTVRSVLRDLGISREEFGPIK